MFEVKVVALALFKLDITKNEVYNQVLGRYYGFVVMAPLILIHAP